MIIFHFLFVCLVFFTFYSKVNLKLTEYRKKSYKIVLVLQTLQTKNAFLYTRRKWMLGCHVVLTLLNLPTPLSFIPHLGNPQTLPHCSSIHKPAKRCWSLIFEKVRIVRIVIDTTFTINILQPSLPHLPYTRRA